MILAAITVIAFIGGLFLLASGVQRLSSPMVITGFISVGVAVAAELAGGYFPLSRLLTLADILPATHAATTDTRKLDLYKEAGRMTRATPDKRPTIVSVERITEPGVFDDVILVYGYPDNYAVAREMAAYASRKYKRDYRFTSVQQ
jgi:hypothetical protein